MERLSIVIRGKRSAALGMELKESLDFYSCKQQFGLVQNKSPARWTTGDRRMYCRQCQRKMQVRQTAGTSAPGAGSMQTIAHIAARWAPANCAAGAHIE